MWLFQGNQEEATGKVTADVETMEAALDQMATAFIQTELRRQYLEDLADIRSRRDVPSWLAARNREQVLRIHYKQIGLREIPDA